MSLLCQAPSCADTATHRAVESDGTTLTLCTPHANYVEAGNADMRKSRQVTVEPLEGSA